jgi:hypothetical protein
MTYVSAEHIEATWRAVGAQGSRNLESMQKRHGKAQKALCRYVYEGFLYNLRQEAAGVGLYAFHVLLEAFLSARPGLRPVRAPMIQRLHESLPDSGNYADLVAASPEPHAMQYVFDVLFEPDDDDVVLSAVEQARCWDILHTAVRCLHEARVR